MDTHLHRKKRQQLMTELLEKKIRLHAQHLYDKRGQAEGLALQDWVQAETSVLENSILAPLYRKSKAADRAGSEFGDESSPAFASVECCGSEASAS